MLGMQMETRGQSGVKFNKSEPIIFDTVIVDGNTSIVYNTIEKRFEFNECGSYLINWWLGLSITLSILPEMVLMISENEEPYQRYSTHTSSAHILEANISGSAILSVKETMTYMQLMMISNQSWSYEYQFVTGTTQAGITILQIV